MNELLQKLRKKDRAAIEEIYGRYGKNLFGYARNKWQVDEDVAWDLVYKTIYRIIEVIDKYEFENEAKLGGFVFKTFVNYMRNHHRDTKDKVVPTTPLVEELAKDHVTDQTEEGTISEEMRLLRAELDKLEDWQRILVLMRAQDHSYEAIAQYVDKSTDQLKVYHGRIRKKLATNINERLNETSNV